MRRLSAFAFTCACLTAAPAAAAGVDSDRSLFSAAFAKPPTGFTSAARTTGLTPAPRQRFGPTALLVVPTGTTPASRWYGYGGTMGRSLGFNLAPNTWSVHGDHLMGDITGATGIAQAGVGWRKGGVQASVGYTRYGDIYRDRTDDRNKPDDRVGLRLSLRRP